MSSVSITPSHSDQTRPAALMHALLSPARIALVGASADPGKNTARPLIFMRRHGFKGVVYPVNRGHASVLGERAYPTLRDLPEPIDHAFIMVPGKHVLPLLDDCAAAGAHVVTIYSDGFAESGPLGVEQQTALLERARTLGLRILGPNSIGLANIHTGCILSVNAVFAAEGLSAGNISMVSQSGSMMGSLMSRAAARGFGFAKSVSVGNEADISTGEIVHGLVDDSETSVILLFLETLRNADVLSSALRRAWAAGKPVIAYKLGRSEIGSRLSESHTGAIAGDDAAVDAFFRSHGVIRVTTLEALFEAAPLAERYVSHTLPASVRPHIAVITTTGGGAATVVDALGMANVQAVAPPASFIDHMAGRGLKIRPSPIMDLTLAASGEQYQDLLEQLLRSDWCDAVLSVGGSSAQFHPELVVRPLIDADKPPDKPLAVFLAPEAQASLRLLREAGMAAFRTPESCADALAGFLGRRPPTQPAAAGASWAWPRGLPRHGLLNEHEASQLLNHLGIKTAAACLLDENAEPHHVGYPAVLKVCSRDIPHKTEADGVRTGIRDRDDLLRQRRALLASVRARRPDARIEGVLVQKMEEGLLELILGYRHDALVGPVVLLGAGGIMAELQKDFAIRLAPVDEESAREMIAEVRATHIVRGYRGLPLGDCDALARAIVDFSRLAAGDVCVAEAEINPLFVQPDGVVAVDALVRLD